MQKVTQSLHIMDVCDNVVYFVHVVLPPCPIVAATVAFIHTMHVNVFDIVIRKSLTKKK